MQRCSTDRNITQWQVDWRQGFWVPLWLWMGLAALCILSCVIYELDGNNLMLSVSSGLISVVMSWFPDFWSFSALNLGAGTHEDAVFLETSFSSFFFFSLGCLCYPVSFVCAAGKLNGITSTPHLPRSRSKLETVFLEFESHHAASEKPGEAIHLVWSWKLTWSPPNELFQIL